MEQDEIIDIDSIIANDELKPYFLDVVGKSFLKNLNNSHDHRYLSKLKAQKDFYDSLYFLSEKLKYLVPAERIQPTIAEVLKHYMQSLKPIMRSDNFGAL